MNQLSKPETPEEELQRLRKDSARLLDEVRTLRDKVSQLLTRDSVVDARAMCVAAAARDIMRYASRIGEWANSDEGAPK